MPVMESNKEDVSNLNGKMNPELGLDENVKFDSHFMDETVKKEVNFSTDFVDEPDKPKKIKHFYLVKYPSIEEAKLKTKMDQADEDLKKLTDSWLEVTMTLKLKKVDRSELFSQWELEKKHRGIYLDRHQFPVMFCHETRKSQKERDDPCSSLKELNNLIRSLYFRTQHGSNTLVEEKHLLQEIKRLEGTREKVLENEANAIHKCICCAIKLDHNSHGVREEMQLISWRIKNLKEQVKFMDNEIISLEEDVTTANKRRHAAYELSLHLIKQCDTQKGYQLVLNKVRELIAQKNIAALEEICSHEVEKFMSLWIICKYFRDDFVKKNLPSLDNRQLSKDGRIKNPDEK